MESDIESFFLHNHSLQVSEITTMSGSELKLIHFYDSDRNSIIQLVNQLKPNDTVLFVGHVIVDEIGRNTAALTNQINVRLKDENDFPILQEAIAPYDISKVRQSEVNNRRYVLTVNCVSGTRVLQIANELHRTGLFEWAEVNLILFFGFGI